MLTVKRVPTAWEKNAPIFVELDPGDSIVREIKLTDGSWTRLSLSTEGIPEHSQLNVRGVYENHEKEHANAKDVWTGKVVSPELKLRIVY